MLILNLLCPLKALKMYCFAMCKTKETCNKYHFPDSSISELKLRGKKILSVVMLSQIPHPHCCSDTKSHVKLNYLPTPAHAVEQC